MNENMRRKLRADIRNITARVGTGRERRFANVIDLSPLGVAKWRQEMGLELTDEQLDLLTRPDAE